MKHKTIIALTVLATIPAYASCQAAETNSKIGPAEEVLFPAGYFTPSLSVSEWLASSIAKDQGKSASEYVRGIYTSSIIGQKDTPLGNLPSITASSSFTSMNLLTISVAQNARLIEQNDKIIELLTKVANK